MLVTCSTKADERSVKYGWDAYIRASYHLHLFMDITSSRSLLLRCCRCRWQAKRFYEPSRKAKRSRFKNQKQPADSSNFPSNTLKSSCFRIRLSINSHFPRVSSSICKFDFQKSSQFRSFAGSLGNVPRAKRVARTFAVRGQSETYERNTRRRITLHRILHSHLHI